MSRLKKLINVLDHTISTFNNKAGLKVFRPAIRCYVVLPLDRPLSYPILSDAARHFVDGIRIQAEGFFNQPINILAIERSKRLLWHLSEGRFVTISSFPKCKIQIFMNAGFLLADPPPIEALLDRAAKHNIAWCGAKSSRETHAFAFRHNTVSMQYLWQVLVHLTACLGNKVEEAWAEISKLPFLKPSQAHIENSPALNGVSRPWSMPSFDSTLYLNTALKEILSNPLDLDVVAGKPARMARAFLAQRDVSRVPWIFNSLINEIEYRVGCIKPKSFPPEVHLSITGACNIECRFCIYSHNKARSDYLQPAQIDCLDFLKYAQSLRLGSGPGEPTINMHLPTIINYLSDRFPHLGINMFTNAVALNRSDLRASLIGKVKWINVSINAASRECWEKICKADLFERVCNNIRNLHREKRNRRSIYPLVFASMVLTKQNIPDLPHMPALCRELGVDRFTAFPYFGLWREGPEKYGSDKTLHACRDQYDILYAETLRQAELNEVSIEIPPPSDQIVTSRGLEVRKFADFSLIESNEWKLARFLSKVKFDQALGNHCDSLWRAAHIGNANKTSYAQKETHYLYPCIGALVDLDWSYRLPFPFPNAADFRRLWSNSIFRRLRKAQHEHGVCPICDVCRETDTRDPKNFPILRELLEDFTEKYLVPAKRSEIPRCRE